VDRRGRANAEIHRPNAEAEWKRFDPERYSAKNYGKLRDDDRAIIERMRDFFGGAGIPAGAHGVDVGSGANLYPTFAMLPFCANIELREFAGPNVHWLREQIRDFDRGWDPFWRAYTGHHAYRAVGDPRAALAQRATVIESSIFDLPEARWDVGTMFFVACSLSTEMDEFEQAVACFVRSLKAGAPFAAAFMENSGGYFVNDVWFPAVRVGRQEIEDSLASVAYNVRLKRISTRQPLRDDYNGMLLALGRANGPT